MQRSNLKLYTCLLIVYGVILEFKTEDKFYITLHVTLISNYYYYQVITEKTRGGFTAHRSM